MQASEKKHERKKLKGKRKIKRKKYNNSRNSEHQISRD